MEHQQVKSSNKMQNKKAGKAYNEEAYTPQSKVGSIFWSIQKLIHIYPSPNFDAI